ncbi:hypothetical protein SO802_012878 [Lithocarpus litseifolius]|uniref:RNase H type-1 domain-containing protein n=1 Tax=Lithocarpus litseifolius TaxID=425828 RepID=A0AAW2D410_9ROSI
MVNLARRQVVNSDLCSNCNSVPEDVVHAVWSCKAVEGVWQTLSWTNPLVHAQPGNFSNLFASFLQVTEDYRAEIFILAAWFLWNRWNAVRLNRPTHPLDQTLSVAGGLLQEYINAQPNLPTPDQLPITHQWRPPDQPRFKANFDGAVFSNINAAGIGVVIRNSNAEVIGALSRRIPLPQMVEEVEALACHEAAKLVKEISVSEVVFEGDSAIIVQALKHGQANQSVYGHILDDVMQQTSHLQVCDFSHVSRTCNKVANFLAKKARIGSVSQVWLEDFPRDLISLAFADSV